MLYLSHFYSIIINNVILLFDIFYSYSIMVSLSTVLPFVMVEYVGLNINILQLIYYISNIHLYYLFIVTYMWTRHKFSYAGELE